MHYCKECKLPVLVTEKGKIIKACKCNAPVVAEMKATVYSQSKLKN